MLSARVEPKEYSSGAKVLQAALALKKKFRPTSLRSVYCKPESKSKHSIPKQQASKTVKPRRLVLLEDGQKQTIQFVECQFSLMLGISLDEILGVGEFSGYPHPFKMRRARIALVALAYKMTGLSTLKVARHFGLKNHTSVYHARDCLEPVFKFMAEQNGGQLSCDETLIEQFVGIVRCVRLESHGPVWTRGLERYKKIHAAV